MTTEYEYNDVDNNNWINFWQWQWLFQTVTRLTPHTITSIKLKLAKSITIAGATVGLLTVSIKAVDANGLPTGPDLTSGTMNGDSIAASAAVYEVPVTEIPAPAKYAIVLNAANAANGVTLLWYLNSTGGYSGGNMGASTNSGSTWTGEPYDAVFEVWGNPITPTGYALTVNVAPPGVSITVDGVTETGPYTGTLTAGSHTVAVPPTITAGTPIEPCQFMHWSDLPSTDAQYSSPTRTVNLTAAMTITAVYGMLVQAVPDASHSFGGWTLDGANAGTANPIVVPVDASHTLSVAFTAIPVLVATSPGYSLTEVNTTGHTTRQSTGHIEKDFEFYPLVNATPDVAGSFEVDWMWQNYIDGKAAGSSAHTAGVAPAVGDIVNIFPSLVAAVMSQLQLIDNRDPATTGRDPTQNGSEAIGDFTFVDLNLEDGKWHTFLTEFTALIKSPSGATVTVTGQLQDNFMYPAPTVSLNVVAGTGGSVNPSGAQTLTVGSSYTFQATVLPGYKFDHWDLSGASQGAANPLVLTAAASMNGQTLTAVFVQNTITITVQASTGGNVSPSGPQTLTIGQPYQYAALVDTGYEFDHWDMSGQNLGSTNPLNLVAAASMNGQVLTTYFTTVPPVQVTINIATVGGGSVNLVNGPHTFNVGDTVTFTAAPQTDNAFSNWTIGGATYPANPLTLIIAQSMNGETLTANFTLTAINLNVAAGANGSVAPSGSMVLTVGQAVVFVASPNTGYVFDHWNLNGQNVGSSQILSLTVTSSMNGYTLTALFATAPPEQVTINIVVSGLGSTNPPAGPTPLNVGQTVSLTAVAQPGAEFIGWNLAGTPYSSNPLDLVITESMNGETLTADFSTPSAGVAIDAPTAAAVVVAITDIGLFAYGLAHFAGLV